MDEEKNESIAPKRLAKVAYEFNISQSTLVDFLNNAGFAIENKPTSKVTDEAYMAMLKKFSPDKLTETDKKGMSIGEEKLSELIKEPIQELRALSKELYNAYDDENMDIETKMARRKELVKQLNRISKDQKMKFSDEYKKNKGVGVVVEIRRETSQKFLRNEDVDYKELEEIIDRSGSNSTWYKIFGVFLKPLKLKATNAIECISSSIQKYLEQEGNVKLRFAKFGFVDNHYEDAVQFWVAFYKSSAGPYIKDIDKDIPLFEDENGIEYKLDRLEKAKQLIVHFRNGKVRYCYCSYDPSEPFKEYEPTILEANDSKPILTYFKENLYKILDMPEPDNVTNLETQAPSKNYDGPLNTILYGPPGTGKTYSTIDKAVEITDLKYYLQNKNDRVQLQKRYNELLIDWQKSTGQIAFITFHQSFSYEDFIEGIKPKTNEERLIEYEIKDGIFKQIVSRASAYIDYLPQNNPVNMQEGDFDTTSFYKISLGDSTKEVDQEIYDYCIANAYIAIGFGEDTNYQGKNEQDIKKLVSEGNLEKFGGQSLNMFINDLKIGNYVLVSKGNQRVRAIGKVTGEYEFRPDAEIPYKQFRKVDWIVKDADIPINEIYEKVLSQQTIYKLNRMWLKESFFVEKKSKAETEKKNFILIIDEINRGNVSQIFGELITLIEEDKRKGNSEAMKVTLPYSITEFTIPNNLYIIGTMNTADRSVEALDTALRRRFSFEEMTPRYDLPELEREIEGFSLKSILQKINNRIEKLLNKDHLIGHSYFMSITNLKGLQEVFNNKIIPLLQEYFFGDYGKIGLVLGKGFFEDNGQNNISFADFEDYDGSDYNDKPIYKLADVSKMKDEKFKEAINKLLKQ